MSLHWQNGILCFYLILTNVWDISKKIISWLQEKLLKGDNIRTKIESFYFKINFSMMEQNTDPQSKNFEIPDFLLYFHQKEIKHLRFLIKSHSKNPYIQMFCKDCREKLGLPWSCQDYRETLRLPAFPSRLLGKVRTPGFPAKITGKS